MFALIEPLSGTVKSVTVNEQKSTYQRFLVRKQRCMHARAHREQQNLMDSGLHLHEEWLLSRPAALENSAYRGRFCHVSNLRASA